MSNKIQNKMKTKTISANTQFKNALRWLENLRRTKRLKGTGLLMSYYNSHQSQTIHNEGKNEYCCLGVGCKLFKIEPGSGWDSDTSLEFEKTVGIQDRSIIFGINDAIFGDDRDFKNVRKEIIKQCDSIFKPKVAKLIKKHFKNVK